MTSAIELRLIGTWRHSHEEDTARETVYRNNAYAFPPSRGRRGFQFNADHTGSALNLSPRDGTAAAAFKWELVDGATPLLRLTYAGGAQEELRVLSIDSGRMVIEKP